MAEVTELKAGEKPGSEEASWHHLLAAAKLELDEQGRPVLQVRAGAMVTTIGVTRDNVLNSAGPRAVVQELLVARLREELKGGRAPKISEAEVRRDWKLLKLAFTSSIETSTDAELRPNGLTIGSD